VCIICELTIFYFYILKRRDIVVVSCHIKSLNMVDNSTTKLFEINVLLKYELWKNREISKVKMTFSKNIF